MLETHGKITFKGKVCGGIRTGKTIILGKTINNNFMGLNQSKSIIVDKAEEKAKDKYMQVVKLRIKSKKDGETPINMKNALAVGGSSMSIPPNKKTEHAPVLASKNQHGPEREN